MKQAERIANLEQQNQRLRQKIRNYRTTLKQLQRAHFISKALNERFQELHNRRAQIEATQPALGEPTAVPPELLQEYYGANRWVPAPSDTYEQLKG